MPATILASPPPCRTRFGDDIEVCSLLFDLLFACGELWHTARRVVPFWAIGARDILAGSGKQTLTNIKAHETLCKKSLLSLSAL
jgi:hypothetical protein